MSSQKLIIDQIGKGKEEIVLEVKQGERLTCLILGRGREGRKRIQVRLVGPRASAMVLGAVVGWQGETEIEILQHHLAPDTQSELIIKSVIFDAAHFIYRGLVRVEPEAQRTSASQVNQNLLVGGAKVETYPQLEILSDDVCCTHGAAVGRIDPEALFYLMSRGIKEKQAKTLLSEGFFEPVLKRVIDKNVLIEARQAIHESLEEAFK